MEFDEERLPSRAAQHSEVGMALSRKTMATDRQAALRRRQSTQKMNQVSPDADPQVQEVLEKHGLLNISVENESGAQRAMKIIRTIPRPMADKRSLKELLLAGKVQKKEKGLAELTKVKWRLAKQSWKEFKYVIEIWRSSLKKIEGHQGTAVLSYFVFLRSLFFLNIFMFLMLFWVITFFQVSFSAAGYDSSTLGDGDTTTYQTLADTCSALYEPNVSHNALAYILDFVQGTGWMEDTAMFYGFYTNQELKLAVSEYNMPLAYFLTAIILLLTSLVVMVRGTLSNFKETVLARENRAHVNYCNMTFAGMDYSMDEDLPMKQLQKSLYSAIVADLDEQRFELRRKKRNRQDKCILFTKRFFINFLILAMLGGAGAAIYYAQEFSSDFTTSKDEDDYNQIVFLLVEFLPAIVIGLLNGIYPIIFGVLVTFEDYRPTFVIKISLVRTVFLKLASLTVIVASLYIQITCNDQTTCLVGQNKCPAIQCWETYVGSAMYKLVIMDFFIGAGFHLLYELPRKLAATKGNCGLIKKIGPAVFDVPVNVLDLVYGQTLCWLGFFFAPLIPAMCVCKLFLTFYLKKLSALYSTVVPDKPYQASKSNSFFMIILMVAYFLVCVPVGYTLLSMEPSPMCGPFRIYKKPIDIINIQIDNSANWFQAVWNILTSSGVVAALIILLILALYYCSALNSAHKELADMMKEQLVMEGKDKQFLLNKLNGTGGQPKKKPPVFQPTKLKTLDETKANGVTSVENVTAPPAAEYTEVWDNNDKHPPPKALPIQKNNNQSNSRNSQSPRTGNVTSVSQVQATTIDDW